MNSAAYATSSQNQNPADYFYSAATHRSRGVLWPIFTPALIWSFAGDAVNTLQVQNVMNVGASVMNDTTFILNACSQCTSPSMTFVQSNASQPSYGYPIWKAKSTMCSGDGSTEASGSK
jgi:hypothetical protein